MTASYTFGTVTVTNGSDMVTGDLTGWQTANVAPGFFGIDTEDGRSVPVAEIIDDNTLRLVIPWRGANAAGVGYYLSYDTRDGQQTVNNSQRLAEYLARLNRNSLLAVASLDPEADTYIKFTGSGTAVLVNASEIEGGGAGGEGGVAVDAYVPDLAARAEYDGRSRGFIVMVGDAGDGRAAIYYKLSTASGDWSDPAYVTGPVGPQGMQGIQGEPGLDGSDGADGTIYTSRGDYSAATEYIVNDTVLFYGSTYVAIQDSVGQSPPMAYGESNAFWQLVAQRGVDGMGTGDVVGPAGAATGSLAVFSGSTGKIISQGVPSSVKNLLAYQANEVSFSNSMANLPGSPNTAQAAIESLASSRSGGVNDAIFALEIADIKGQRLGMVGGVADAFDDETGVATKTNAIYDAANDLYSPAAIMAGDVVTPVSLDLNATINTTRSYRFRIGTAALLSSYSFVRIRIDGPSAGTVKPIVNAFIGRAATSGDAWDMAETGPAPVRLTFSGSSGVTPPVGGSVYSDWVAFPLDNAFAHIVALDYSATSGALRYRSGAPSGYTNYLKDGGPAEAGTPNVSGYGSVIDFIGGLSAIEGKDTMAGVSNMTLQSVSYAASAAPSSGRISAQVNDIDAISVNTDLVARISRDGGTTWATASLSLVQSLIGLKVYEASDVSLSSLSTGTSMKWELRTANNKNVQLSGVVLQWQ